MYTPRARLNWQFSSAC